MLLAQFTAAFWGSCYFHLTAEETDSELRGLAQCKEAVGCVWTCVYLSPKPHGAELTVETALIWRNCLVSGVPTLDKSFPGSRSQFFLRATWGAILQTRLGSSSSPQLLRPIALARSLPRPLQPRAPAAPEVLGSFSLRPPLAPEILSYEDGGCVSV